MTRDGNTKLWREWRRWWAAMHFVDVLYKARRSDVSAHDR